MKKTKTMSEAQRVTPLFKLPRAEEVEGIIDKNLMRDWVIRIEHTDSIVLYNTYWQQWGETRYAIKSTTNLMGDIYDCRARFPEHSIRLSAERVCPQTRLFFSVYQSEHEVKEVDLPLEEAKSLIVERKKVMPNENNSPDLLYSFMGKIRAKVLQIVAIAGVLIMSFLILEEIAVY